jgi:hypothetical protein
MGRKERLRRWASCFVVAFEFDKLDPRKEWEGRKVKKRTQKESNREYHPPRDGWRKLRGLLSGRTVMEGKERESSEF